MIERRQRRIRALQRQCRRLEHCHTKLQEESNRITRWRLLSFLLLFVVGATLLLTLGAEAWAVGSVLLLLPFLLLVRRHRQVEEDLRRADLMLALKKTHLARFSLDWVNLPADQPFDPGPDHPFAHDLDLIGERSLARLLDVSLTQEGGRRLRQWLIETEPDPDSTRRRQACVSELSELFAFRDRLAVNAHFHGAHDRLDSWRRERNPVGSSQRPFKWSGQRLVEWLEAKVDSASLRAVLLLLLFMMLVNMLLFAAYLGGWLPPLWIASWLLYAAVWLSQSRRVGPMFHDAAYVNDMLRQLTAIFSTVENRSFARQPVLRHLLQPLREGSRRPSRQLQRANRLLAAVGLRLNPVLAFLLNAVFPWDVFFGYQLEQFRRDLAAILPGWLDIWYELEALSGLANFAFLNPGAPFAVLQQLSPDSAPHLGDGRAGQLNDETVFDGRNLGHPLIAAEERVGNDFRVDRLGSLTIITGSNMAGKSSFLRTLGVNIRLALAGAPVMADTLALLPFRVAASITVTDSVTDGFSFFYAEVRRLKALLEELRRPTNYPLFFLIDEIFRGTNNRERLIGSRSYVRALHGGNGVGVIATHDLELVKLAHGNAAIGNAHFRDRIEGERMVFDYKLHDGPCPTTNALKIMELAGLPVDQSPNEQ